MIIGLSGKKQVGKDTAGHYLDLVYKFKRVAFADELKKIAEQLSWDGNKDERGRKFLQDLGMVARNYNPDVWIDLAFRRLSVRPDTDFVITDVRFMNEVDAIRKCGGIVVRITRDDEIRDDVHASETELDNLEFDYVVKSVKGDYNSLYKQLDDIVESERSLENFLKGDGGFTQVST